MMETIMNENNQQQKEVEMEELQQLLNAVYEATKSHSMSSSSAEYGVRRCVTLQF